MADNAQVITVELNFSDSKLPEFKKVNNKSYILFGEDDKYPEYLLYLYGKSPKHGAIVGGKKDYIFGGGLKSDDATVQNWLKKINSAGESGNDVAEKSLLDIEIFGGFYWQVIFNAKGAIQDIYHVEFHKVRSNEDNTEFYYKRNWADRKEDIKKFPAFDPDEPKTSIFFYTEYRPNSGAYCLPGYISSNNYIEADVEVSKHTLTNSKTGFSASKFINFYNGEPEEDKKKVIERRFNEKFTGSEGKKIIIGFNNDPNKKPTIDDLGSSDLTKEDFKAVDDLISSNIYAGHRITSPILFGIKEEGQLGGHNELRIAYEIFNNTYVKAKQAQFERIINQFASFKGLATDIKLIKTDPVGIEFTDQTLLQAAPRSWLLEKMGIDTTKYTDGPVGAKAATEVHMPGGAAGEQQMVNDNIKNLTAKQHQQLMRIIRQYSKGQLTRQAATTLLKTSLGLNDEDISSLLGIEDGFSADFTEEDVADMFSETGESREQFEVIQSKEVKFESDKDAIEFEMSFFLQFAEDAAGNEVPEPGILDEIRKKIGDIKKITRKLPKIQVMYSYEVMPGVGAAVIPTTRPFCRKLVELDRFYTRQQIEAISERLGYSVWNRRGGFWNNNGTIEPHCRHMWKSNVVIKKS
jgi:hypothetical protein